MRVVDLGEWRVLRGVHPHLVTATESALQSLNTDEVTTNLRDTLEFLYYELQNLVIVVPTHRNLDEDAISLFKSEVKNVFPLLDKLLARDTSCLLGDAVKGNERKGRPEWMQDSFEALKVIPLDDLELCSSVVLALESFNRCMEAQFWSQLRQSTPLVDQTDIEPAKKSLPNFDGRHKEATETLLSAVQKQLDECKNEPQHQILLQLAGRAWQAAKRGSRSLYLSSCGNPTGWQEIEYIDEDDSDRKNTRCVRISKLCTAILESLCYNELFKLHKMGHTLYRINHNQNPPRQQNGVPAVSLGQLIDTECFLPLSSDRPISLAFTVSEKRELTLDLSWCLMHLFNCNWTDDCWSVEKIFLLAPSSESFDALLRGVPPYMVCERTKSPSTGHSGLTSLLGDSIFLKFGKLLVEIEIGHKVVATEKNNLGYPSLWLTIDKIISEGQMPSACDNYLKAIEGCLNLHRETYYLDPGESAKELSKQIYDSIVVNLEQDYSHYRRPHVKRRRSPLQEFRQFASKGTPSPKTIGSCSLQNMKVYLSSNQDDEESSDESQHTGPENVQIIADSHIAKRARLGSSSLSRQMLGNDTKQTRRSPRLALQASTSKKPITSPDRPIASKANEISSQGTSTYAGGRTRGFQIFDDIPEQLHDGRTLAISKSFFDTFDDFLASYFPFKSELSQVRNNNRKSQRIKVCVIDTGIDMTHPSVMAAKMGGRLGAVKSWKDRPIDMTDKHGHGTHAAELILRVAPEADLYVAKAIKWALSQDVDIISMSFGLDKRDDDLDEIINRAAAAGKILMAAAGNHGNNGPKTFPATNRNVICIHASDGKGKDGRISPQPVGNDDNFMTLGMAVPLTWLSKEVVRSGTSFATPIAAGIAADVLEISRRTISMTTRQENRLHSSDGMRRIFQLLSPSSDSGYRYVVPWSLWTPGRTEGMIRESLLEALDR
ncbi:Fc.00g037480.m01.CDS01 [Cosmosporella sp. VM-42]